MVYRIARRFLSESLRVVCRVARSILPRRLRRISRPNFSFEEVTMDSPGMKNLISVYNKLQNLQTIIGRSAAEGVNLGLPQIVVVGGQSAGKSSVLEGFVGRDFLPRGAGIVTRVPLVLQLVHTPDSDVEAGDVKEWGEFLHKKGQKFTDFDEIREEIEAQTQKLAGNAKDVMDLPINLKICSPNVVNITLVDLPGLVKVHSKDQPEDIEEQIRRMIIQYIQPDNVIILAVTPINADMATSDALKLAKVVDPKGLRTLAVLTKLDLMDDGTDAREALSGRIIPVKLGIIGVVNRSQKDIKEKESIEDCLKDEKKFFEENYPELTATNGTPYLAKILHELLMEKLQVFVPQYKTVIKNQMDEQAKILESLGEAITPENKNKILLRLIQKVAAEYCQRIDGQVVVDSDDVDLDDGKLSGGAKISRDIFYGKFKEELEEIVPLHDVSQSRIRNMLRGTAGLQPHVFVSDDVFFKLVKKEVKRLIIPSEQCVGRVYAELKSLIETSGPECKRDFDRFPRLRNEMIRITHDYLEERKLEAINFVKDQVNIHAGFVNTRHKDFEEESAELLNAQQRWRLEQEDAKRQAEHEEDSEEYSRLSREERENEDCDMMRNLTMKYFGITKDAVEDSVPKAIVMKLIQPVKDNIQVELYDKLVGSGAVNDLVEESRDTDARRKEATRTKEALFQALTIVEEV